MTQTYEPNGQASKTRTTFRMECGVAIRIDAPPEKVWSLLTNLADFPKWNSTVESIEGKIEDGAKLAIKVPSAPGRTFSPRVSAIEPNRSMVWSDGFAPMFRGVRTFSLTPTGGGTEFRMVEVFSGAMLPMIAGSLPDFVPIFTTYAADLKRRAESA